MAVLIVEPNQKEAQTLADAVRGSGLTPFTTDTMKSALYLMKKENLRLVLLNMNGSRQRLADFLETSQSLGSKVPVVITADRASLDDATHMMGLGAHDFWVKPIPGEKLTKAIELLEAKATQGAAAKPGALRPIIARNSLMLQLTALAKKIAPTSATVFVQGESGTGKEMFARYIHHHSDRRDKPFVALNCAALPEGLLESELFGHEKGAFTGAIKNKEGKFELAHSGTLLLDEITEIPVHLQAKLLRVLQENEVDRVGGRYPIPVDVRIIATTNTDVERLVAEGRFRRDLYYRLNVIPIKIPALGDRPDDIELLAQHFVSKYSLVHGRPVNRIAPATLERLRNHSWPGNVRELENVVQRAVLLSNGQEITADCLLFDAAPQQENHTGIELMALSKMEKLMIDKALEAMQGNRTKASELLGISVRTLRNKLQEYRQQQGAAEEAGRE